MESKEITAMGASAEEDTIDLMEIFRALRKRWYWIVLLAIIFGAIFADSSLSHLETWLR